MDLLRLRKEIHRFPWTLRVPIGRKLDYVIILTLTSGHMFFTLFGLSSHGIHTCTVSRS